MQDKWGQDRMIVSEYISIYNIRTTIIWKNIIKYCMTNGDKESF